MPNETATETFSPSNAICGACNGTGRYSGASRWGSRCFPCNGTGHQRGQASEPHVVSGATLNAMPNQEIIPARMNRAERNWYDFAARYPMEAAWLQSPAAGDFGASLINGCRRYGGLTPRQLAAVQRNVTVFPMVAPEPVVTPVVSPAAWMESPRTAAIVGMTPEGRPVTEQDVRNGAQVTLSSMVDVLRNETARNGTSPRASVPAIMIDATNVRRAMDAAAASGLRKVRLVLGTVTFKLSGSRWSHGAGMILCYENGSYAGWIDRSDVFHKATHRTVTDDMLALFRGAAADPQAAARTYGQDTGRCACCRRLLTDPVSVMSNIGPICAERFGWGRMIRTARAI